MKAVAALDWQAVKDDINQTLINSQDWWPADNGHYGPLMIRLAWHCAGSYRISDGHGGCDGGRNRFDPERSWADNTNLDKARKLLWPIKVKYGNALSWGDLIILTGTVAIRSMGGPVLGFCAGRIDDTDGSESVLLGPSAEQQADYPCPVNGQCKSPLGPTTVGLIYVNPEGPMGQPDPSGSWPQIRDSFGRMAMNDSETVALIGGGHAFGKAHGACPTPPGPSPAEDPLNPWPGRCGSGKGKDTVTAGFEGPWTDTPTKWSNAYFNKLLNYQWTNYSGPGEHQQWKAENTSTMMLTSDVSLLFEPTYLDLVRNFAANPAALDEAFKNAWYKLVTRDMGPVTRCLGKWTAPAQSWQYPLPPTAPDAVKDIDKIRDAITKVMTTASTTLDVDYDAKNKPSYAGMFVHMAYQSASSFRRTDYLGGPNCGRIRFEPQSKWADNVGVDKAFELLKPVITQFPKLSSADLIIAAGQIGLDALSSTGPGSNGSTSLFLSFCGGRTDAADGKGSEYLSPSFSGQATPHQMRAKQALLGLSSRELVALQARPRSLAQQARLGYQGTWASTSAGIVSNLYFKLLLNNTWVNETLSNGYVQYRSVQSPSIVMMPTDINLLYDSELLSIVQEFAGEQQMFYRAFSAAWTRLMNIDRFQGPLGNVCNSPSSSPASPASADLAWYYVAIISTGCAFLLSFLMWLACCRTKRGETNSEPLLH